MVFLGRGVQREKFFGKGVEDLGGFGIGADGDGENPAVGPDNIPDFSIGENPGVRADGSRGD